MKEYTHAIVDMKTGKTISRVYSFNGAIKAYARRLAAARSEGGQVAVDYIINNYRIISLFD